MCGYHASYFELYSPECVEGKFCELRLLGLLGSSQHLAMPSQPQEQPNTSPFGGCAACDEAATLPSVKKLLPAEVGAMNFVPQAWAPMGRGEPVVQLAAARGMDGLVGGVAGSRAGEGEEKACDD
jgi:hypothetical protein